MTRAAQLPRPKVVRAAASDLLGSLALRSFDVLLTDPPYQTVDRHGGGHLRRWFRGSLSWPQITRLLTMARRRMRPGGIAMLVVNEAGLPQAQATVRQAGFSRLRVVVWDQRRPGLGAGLRHQVGYVVIGLQPGSRALSGRDLVSVAAVAPGTKNRYPTEKPVGLGRELAAIAGVRRGDTVVDPFCGSGNLLIGAAERGAHVLAGDTSARAVRLATTRLAAAAAKRGRPLLDSSQISGTRRPPRRAKPRKAVRNATAQRANGTGRRR